MFWKNRKKLVTGGHGFCWDQAKTTFEVGLCGTVKWYQQAKSNA